MTNIPNTADASRSRIDWVDYAKGLCIIFVVMMHSTLGVGKHGGEEGWMHLVVQWAQPFRMPDFFMVAGLFLAVVIDRNWRRYLDRKVLHFVYFYLLWVTIQFVVKAPNFASEHGWAHVPYLYLRALVLPFGTLWFIYMLPVMFVVTKALKFIPWYVMLAAAALLEAAPVETGILLVDEFAARYVFFFAGYALAQQIFKIAAWVQENRMISVVALLTWAVLNGLLVFNGVYHKETLDAQFNIIALGMGTLGALAIILVSSLLATLRWMDLVRYCGANSIVIYLAFFFPMIVSREILLRTGVITDIGTISAIVTATAVISPLVLYWIIEKIGFGKFLFERPEWAKLPSERDSSSAPNKRQIVPAE